MKQNPTQASSVITLPEHVWSLRFPKLNPSFGIHKNNNRPDMAATSGPWIMRMTVRTAALACDDGEDTYQRANWTPMRAMHGSGRAIPDV